LLLAAAGAVAFSAKGIIVKLAFAHGVDAVTVVMLRMAFAFPVFFAMALFAGRGKAPLTLADWAQVGALGLSGYYLASMLDFAGLQYISASLERLVLYLNPTLVLILGWLLHGARWGRLHIVGTGVSYAGVAVVFSRELQVAGDNVPLGFAMVLASAVFYAIYLVYSGQLVRRLGAFRLVGLAMSVACLLCITHYFLAHPLTSVFRLPTAIIQLSLLNAFVGAVFPVLITMLAVERIGAAATAQVGLVGPIATMALGMWILGEQISWQSIAGTCLVIMGIVLFARAGSR